MPSKHQIFSIIPVSYQNIIIEGYNTFDSDIELILNQDELVKSINRGRNISKQTIYFLMLSHLFGIELGVIHSILSTDRARTIRNYHESLFERVISKSWVYKNGSNMLELHPTALERLFCKFQDFYFMKIGKTSRFACKELFKGSNQKFTVPIECFFGIIPPSEIFPDVNSYSRGEMMPHFTALIFKYINRISSTAELDGKLKKTNFMNFRLVFELAGRVGFINQPPGKMKLYYYSNLLEEKLHKYEKAVDRMLIKENVQDLSVNSIDGCNIPVDCRDKEASNGTGSKGFFLDIKPP